MDKPITLAQREFKDKIVQAINDSGLPAFVISPVLRQALDKVEEIEEQQYLADKKAYEEMEENNNGETSETC